VSAPDLAQSAPDRPLGASARRPSAPDRPTTVPDGGSDVGGRPRHLLSVAALSRGRLEELLALTEVFVEVAGRDIPRVPALRGRSVALCFFEDSTRTRLSFELAAKRLSADVVSFAAASSSLNKGESLRDTVETIDAMGVDLMVVRHRASGVPAQVSRWVRAGVVNAGDGWHEHPTQALLDCFTVRRALAARGRVQPGLEGLRIGIVGDVEHSRVARSDVAAFATLGAEVVVVSPPTLRPSSVGRWPARFTSALDPELPELDALYVLRLQRERMGSHVLPGLREYRACYGVDARRAAMLPPHAVVLHPGPMNRGVEIDAEVADSPRSLVLEQVASGVPARMAVLSWLAGGEHHRLTPPPVDAEAESGLGAGGGRPGV
jgi:aspartate carbamoyltransferase catalytic subunit